MKAELPQADLVLFAPMDKRAFGAAIGVVAALSMILLTAEQILVAPHPALNLELLSQYFAGYRVSWAGALIGGAWAFAVGFCAGWFTAFVRNLVLALSLFAMRSRAELDESRDFLDHI